MVAHPRPRGGVGVHREGLHVAFERGYEIYHLGLEHPSVHEVEGLVVVGVFVALHVVPGGLHCLVEPFERGGETLVLQLLQAFHEAFLGRTGEDQAAVAPGLPVAYAHGQGGLVDEAVDQGVLIAARQGHAAVLLLGKQPEAVERP